MHADETSYVCWRVFSVILTEDLIKINYTDSTMSEYPCLHCGVVNNKNDSDMDTVALVDGIHTNQKPIGIVA